MPGTFPISSVAGKKFAVIEYIPRPGSEWCDWAEVWLCFSTQQELLNAVFFYLIGHYLRGEKASGKFALWRGQRSAEGTRITNTKLQVGALLYNFVWRRYLLVPCVLD